MRLILYIFLIICWTFLVLAPLNALAENITFTCKPVVAGMPKKDGNFYIEDFPSYFTLFNCKSDSVKEPIEVEWSDDPSKKIS